MALKCTFEGCTFTTKPHSKYAKQELGRHMKFTHQIAGASSSAKTMQAKKEDALSENTETTDNGSSPKASKRSYNKAIKEDDTRILIFVGKITALCEIEAERVNSPREQFTQRCAQLFYASQVR